jgi:hypothetical protein
VCLCVGGPLKGRHAENRGEIAVAVAWLCSDATAFVGHALTVDGGMTVT